MGHVEGLTGERGIKGCRESRHLAENNRGEEILASRKSYGCTGDSRPCLKDAVPWQCKGGVGMSLPLWL